MMELNPNHPVTAANREHWHKLCALLMVKQGLTTVEFTMADVARLHGSDAAIVVDEREGRLRLHMMPMQEAERLAREEGGLPV